MSCPCSIVVREARGSGWASAGVGRTALAIMSRGKHVPGTPDGNTGRGLVFFLAPFPPCLPPSHTLGEKGTIPPRASHWLGPTTGRSSAPIVLGGPGRSSHACPGGRHAPHPLPSHQRNVPPVPSALLHPLPCSRDGGAGEPDHPSAGRRGRGLRLRVGVLRIRIPGLLPVTPYPPSPVPILVYKTPSLSTLPRS
jgi:hypothetical protein